MLDYKDYVVRLGKLQLLELTCIHCGALVKSANAKEGVCNFCEQYTSVFDAKGVGKSAALDVFSAVRKSLEKGFDAEDFKGLNELVKNNSDPMVFYVSGLLYLLASDVRYCGRNYELEGFMEENYDNIRGGMDLMSSCRECFSKAVAVIDASSSDGTQAKNRTYTKFMSEVRLHRMADAQKTLQDIVVLADDPMLDYATMVADVESGSKDAEKSLSASIAKNEVNAFYYLAAHLAKKGRLAEAKSLLMALGAKADVRMSANLLRSISSAQAASEL
ncbi:Uncharacterised protein [uncultured archaeon]|nr:Uncharacterised protein [uncultured archaeon]